MDCSQALLKLELFRLDARRKHAAYLFMQRPEVIERDRFQSNARIRQAGLFGNQQSTPCQSCKSWLFQSRQLAIASTREASRPLSAWLLHLGVEHRISAVASQGNSRLSPPASIVGWSDRAIIPVKSSQYGA
jgi:hypothetical protein